MKRTRAEWRKNPIRLHTEECLIGFADMITAVTFGDFRVARVAARDMRSSSRDARAAISVSWRAVATEKGTES